MKVAKITLFALLAALVAVGVSTTSYAFHSGGVAECGGCHSMHAPKAGGSFLLIGTDQSSTCLTCHMHAGDTGPSSYHISTATADMPAGMSPEAEDARRRLRLAEEELHLHGPRHHDHEDGETHGHNIVAADLRLHGRSDEQRRHRAGRSRRPTSAARAATTRTARSALLGRHLRNEAARRSRLARLRSSLPARITTAPLRRPGRPSASYRLLRGLQRRLPSGVTSPASRSPWPRPPTTRPRRRSQVRVAYGGHRRPHDLGQLVRDLPPEHALHRQLRPPGRSEPR